MQVNTILQQCAEIIQELQHEDDCQSQCHQCQESSLSQCQDDVTSTNRSPCQEDDVSSQLWWDESPSVSQLVSPVDSAIYTLSFLGGDGGLSDVGEWSTGEKEDCVSVFSGASHSVEDVTSSSSVDYVDSSPVSQPQASSTIIDDLISFVGAAAPAGVYNAAKARRRRKRRCDKAVVPYFRAIWRNVDAILNTPARTTQPSPTQSSPYVVDFSNVNGRYYNNLPKAEWFPILGCSQDPEFYDEKTLKKTEVRNQCAYRVRCYFYGGPNKLDYSLVHGTALGYMTDVGVVPVPQDVTFQGFTYTVEQGWVLKASKREDIAKARSKGGYKSKQRKGGHARHMHQEFTRPPDTRSASASTSRTSVQRRRSLAGPIK